MLRRYVLCIQYPRKITNEQLYEKTKVTPWSCTIEKRRISFIGHILRLDKNTPARKAYDYAKMKYTRRKGRQKITLFDIIEKTLSKINVNLNEFERLATDKKMVNQIISRL